MSLRQSIGVVALAVLLAAATACGGAREEEKPGSERPAGAQVQRGGTLRLGLVTLDDLVRAATLPPRFDLLLDPQWSYDPGSWEVLRCCLLRTLLSYNGRPTDEGGAELRPDLAAAMPEVSADGLTWTFRLKKGIRYAPPLEELEVKAPDVIRAMERLLTPAPRALAVFNPYLSLYFFYYLGAIEGTQEFAEGKADTISGMEAPDDYTLVIHLTEPSGDLGYRFSLPATAPIPPDPVDPSARLGAADGHEEGYGPFLVATGPYMLGGSEKLDFSLPAAEQKPGPGYVRSERVTLVRNPSWNPLTDRLRSAYADRIELIFEASLEEAAAKVETGALDLVFDTNAPLEQVQRFEGDPELADQVFRDPSDFFFFLAMNLAVPPFDDIHVRKAVNWVIDKASLRQLANSRPFNFGPAYGGISSHISVNSVTRNLLLDYDPYATPGHRGDLARAKGEMALSRYDGNRDGICDALTCRNVVAVTYRDGALPEMLALVRDNLRRIGISLDVQVAPDLDAVIPRLGTPRERVALAAGLPTGKDYPSGATFFVPNFYGPSIAETGNFNWSLAGATPEQLRSWGYSVTSVPSVDEKIEACLPLLGRAQIQCWAELDQYLMEKVVPWVPYLLIESVVVVSDRVVRYSIDQFTAFPAPDQIALAPGSE